MAHTCPQMKTIHTSGQDTPGSIVNFHNFSWINDNASMFVLGISYNLVKGKSYSEKARKLQNADRDSGMF